MRKHTRPQTAPKTIQLDIVSPRVLLAVLERADQLRRQKDKRLARMAREHRLASGARP